MCIDDYTGAFMQSPLRWTMCSAPPHQKTSMFVFADAGSRKQKLSCKKSNNPEAY